jgi:hypothetical protein
MELLSTFNQNMVKFAFQPNVAGFVKHGNGSSIVFIPQGTLYFGLEENFKYVSLVAQNTVLRPKE